jgi:hypothetical protein
MGRWVVIAVLLALAPGAAVAGAEAVGVVSGLLASTTKTLTRTTCTLQPAAADTSANEANKTANNGAVTQLGVGSGTNARQRVFVRFNLPAGCAASIANAEVDSATLTLFQISGTAGRTYKLYKVSATWTATANWNTQPAVAGTALTTFTGATNSARTIDVTQDVNDIVQSQPTVLPPYASSTSSFGWMVADENAGTSVALFASSENATAANRPKLVVTYAS